MDTRFPPLLSQYLHTLAEARGKGASHDYIRHLFLNFLRDAFPSLEANEVELERHLTALGVRGYIDALYRDIVFEFKRNLEEERAKGLEELGRYLSAQREPQRYLGILTDGQAFQVYVLRDGRLDRAYEFRLEADKPQEGWLWLEGLLFSQKQVVPTTQDVVRRFGERSAVFSQARLRLWEMWRRVRDSGPVATKFREWGRLLAHVYGREVGEEKEKEKLFLRHTYLALLGRLMAYLAVTRQLPPTGELPGLVDGAAFRRLGLPNLVEEDFFAWVLEGDVRDEALSLLGGLAQRLSVYDFAGLNEDLLKELYQELVDPRTRHDLGEFYTPDWLAERTLREAGFGPETSLLDPACGSGTFLFTAIRLLREAGLKGEGLVRHVRERLAGLDIHPLAVIIARCNFVLALASDLPVREAVRIPIYMADALLEGEGMEELIKVPVAGLSEEEAKSHHLDRGFYLPAGLAGEPEGMEGAIEALAEMARAGGDEEAAKAGLRSRLEGLGLGGLVPAFENALRLLRHLVGTGRDTVYAFILRNAYRPVLFSRRRFDLVAGNPPWLSYRYIATPEYQQRVKKMALQDYRLAASHEVKLFTQMEMATLFFAHAYERYLRDGGAIAFVMPRSVLTGAKQHHHFRRRFWPFLERVLDLEGVSPLFNVPACVLIARKGGEAQGPQVVALRGDLPRKNASPAEARKHLAEGPGELPRPTAVRHSPYRERFVQGATIVPRTLWFVRPPEGALAIDPHRPYLETDPSVLRQAKPPWKGLQMQGEVEAAFLYATLLGDDLVPFGYRRLHLVVLPVQAGQDGRLRLVDREEAVKNGWTGLAGWLERAEALWERHKSRTTRMSLLERLDYHGTLTGQSPGALKVVYNRSGTYLTACVLDARAGLSAYGLPVRGLVVESVLYRYETPSPEEAHYLAALLNAPCVDAAVKPYQTKGSFGERDFHRRPFEVLPRPIPPYDPADRAHRRLAELSQACHRKVAEMALPQEKPIGRVRGEVRSALKKELEEIDALARRLLGLHGQGSSPSGTPPVPAGPGDRKGNAGESTRCPAPSTLPKGAR
ncbi:hypothetical protein HRbin23_01425 [bacterium HR23]|nr:hypothetical protein HRbin23_01425 [bacterium HR23]